MPNTNAHLDDIREGFTEAANNGNSPHCHFGFHDTTENENVYVHEVSEPQFDPISDQVPIWSDDQFTHIQKLVPPPSASYSINFGEVAPRPVDMCIAVGELFESKQQLQSQLGRYAFANRFQIKARTYSPRKRYNLTSSNIAEAMNNEIKVCRELPITGVIDCIRGVLQRWFYDRWTSTGKLKSTLTTKADVNIGVKDEKARYLTIYPIIYYSFLVKDGDLDGTVDLTSKTYYCSPYYSSAFLATTYSGEIHPVGHPPKWLVPEDIASIIVLPPVGRRLPGRPKKNRIPSFGEGVSQSRCTTCHRNGHNSH
ncbi:hypothetical protein Ddye_005589 [Dipteronia dyeriana]|uniref:Uncharacterized protein n=1 Tax=Dipteronia dyeriana TaxID=168575 RepID=A0AAD9XGC9_9ROSI|nr:hypothetical protein Ddye_005589 [Dipteronia dyeriana]